MKKTLAFFCVLTICLSMIFSCFVSAETETPDVHDPITLMGDSLKSKLVPVTDNETRTVQYDEANQMIVAKGLKTVVNWMPIKFTLEKEFSGVDYPYMVIKYRYDKAYSSAKISVYRMNMTAGKYSVDYPTETDTPVETVTNFSNRSQDGQIATYSDGEWQTAIINMAEVKFEPRKNYTAGGKTWGDYSLKEFAILPYGWNIVEGSEFQLSTVGFFATEAEAKSFASVPNGVILQGNTLKNALKVTTPNEFRTVEYSETDQAVIAKGLAGKQDQLPVQFNLTEEIAGSRYSHMVIKYKYDKAYASAKLSFFRLNVTADKYDGINNVTATDTPTGTGTFNNRSMDGDIATYSDGEWKTAIIDMNTVNFENARYFRSAGKTWNLYSYKSFSILPYGWNIEANSEFRIEALGFFENEADAKSFAGVNTELKDTATGYVYDADRLELVYQINQTSAVNAQVQKGQDDNFISWKSDTSMGAKASRIYIPFDTDFIASENRYFAIKYQYNDNFYVADMQLMRSINDVGSSNPLSRMFDKSATIVADKQWQTLVIDLTTVEFDNDLYKGKTWATLDQSLNGVYLMPWGGAATNGATINIEILGFAKTEDEARAIVGLDPVEKETETKQEETTAPVTTKEPVTEGATQETTPTTPQESKGCKSSAAATAVILISVFGGCAAMTFRKRKEQ